jgi:hypothetical protein
LTGCTREPHEPPLFTLLTPNQTGITFANTITTSDSQNVQTDSFVYNGGGVAIGDVDNDGLADVFLTGNMVSSRLYLNKGNMRFDDITESAGVGTDRWCYGASMVDIDADGYLDIYIAVSGPEWSEPAHRANLLFLNNGDGTFREAASAYGLADTGFSTHAAFLDYDRDGDVDMYLLTNAPGEFARGEAERHPAGVALESATSHDRFYRNNGDGTFTNVSDEVGILRKVGFGLGIAVADLNADGWPDVYVSNDDTPNDALYANNGDGTFSDKALTWLKHTVFAGMGVDIADFNNDGWFDILQTDMVPESLAARKRMTGAMTYRSYMEFRRRGFQFDYSTNALQLNAGAIDNGDVIFSEISHLAGVPYTSWTWSPLFADFDNDGYKDIHITNGYPKAVIDYDYQTRVFGLQQPDDRTERQAVLDELYTYDAANYLFRNEGDLRFSNKTAAWGLERPSYSYGAAYADLDNDGRLDLVVNNIDAPAFVYHNTRPPDDSTHYVQIRLEGDVPNRRGLGATIRLVAGGQAQYVYQSPYKGYQSTVDDRAHFGLGTAAQVDSLTVVWPDGRHQLLTDLPADRLVTVRQAEAAQDSRTDSIEPVRNRLFRPLEADKGPRYLHQEGSFVDFGVQPLLPHQVSRQGPPLAVGDVTGNGLDDVYVGGAAGIPGALFLQGTDGRFVQSTDSQPWDVDKESEDWGALFFDADGDGLLDLYVASGGYLPSPVSDRLQDRLYLNRGDGRFERDSSALPPMVTSTAALRAGDFTGDGRPDLFVGGRLMPRNYPYPTRSYLLRNEGGRFTDVTEATLPELVRPGGMVTDGVWMDFSGDGRLDLVTAGIWMPVQFYENVGTELRDVTSAVSPPDMRGWWYSLASGDFNGDGLPDLVAGNLGLNHTFQTSPESRFGVYASDFTGNRTTDLVFTKEIDGAEYPFYGMAKLDTDIYTIALQFPTYAAFADAPIQRVFSRSQLEQAVHYQADTFASVYLENGGDGTFTSVPLPNLAQIAPIRAMVADDLDADGALDLLLVGNLYYSEPNTARADAGNGLWLRGDGRGTLTPVPPTSSGFLAPREAVDVALITLPTGRAALVANNADSLQVFRIDGR